MLIITPTHCISMKLLASFSLALLSLFISPASSYDYLDALGKSILFYEGQRSGFLPASQRLNWRSSSALSDGHSQGVDLTGGYYDAGDNVKFGLPMAFTITMLSWSVVEYGNHMSSGGHLSYALEAIRWGTDYLLKAHSEPDVLWGEVGDGNTDHYCWQRPEDMTTPRQAYRIDPSNPGSDLAGETAAAIAAASMVFRNYDSSYSNLLLEHARQIFTFANTYRGKYDNSIMVARKFYQSRSGYGDELLWAAIWLYEATSEEYYLKYVVDNAGTLGGTGWAMTEFSWDVKYAGVQVLATKILLQGRGGYADVLQGYQSMADYFLCGCLQKNTAQNVQRTPGGLMFWRPWNNMQYVTSASFLLSVYSDYLSSAQQQLKCPTGSVEPSELIDLARSQVDYMLGNNPRGTSYMVGFGSNYPQKVHHRAASIVSYKVDSSFVSCKGGYATWFSRDAADPNILVGAVVGGPDEDDNYADDRENYEQSEPAIANNGPIVGVLARLHGGGYGQLNPAPIGPVISKPPTAHLGSGHHSPKHPTANPNHVIITQTVTTMWTFRGLRYYRYEGHLANTSPQTLQSLTISIEGLDGPIWGLSKAEEEAYYTFPNWLQSVRAGESIGFVYIQAAPQAKISVVRASFT